MDGESDTGIVYVLSNPAMPGIIKIGRTNQADVSSRMSQLYSTGVPVPFECEYACEVSSYKDVEKRLHFAFGNSRINPSREFFQLEPEQAIIVLEMLATKDVTPSVSCELDKSSSNADKKSGEKLKKRPKLRFDDLGIPVGAELVFKDGETTVLVSENNKVVLSGEELSLTAATTKILDLNRAIQPSPHWYYEGSTLLEMYNDVHPDN